jgi:hypothetical protein
MIYVLPSGTDSVPTHRPLTAGVRRDKFLVLRPFVGYSARWRISPGPIHATPRHPTRSAIHRSISMTDKIGFFMEKFTRLLPETAEPARYYRPRPYRTAAVRFITSAFEDFDGRRRLLEETGLNVFNFPARKIPGCDLLTDSGTTTMTLEQWSALSYGSNEGYYDLKNQIPETFGPAWKHTDRHRENLFIFHQGRAAEHAFFGVLSSMLRNKIPPDAADFPDGLTDELKSRLEAHFERRRKPYFIIPSNSHFDTTEGNIKDSRMIPLNLSVQGKHGCRVAAHAPRGGCRPGSTDIPHHHEQHRRRSTGFHREYP